MDEKCCIDALEERKFPRGQLPLDSCRECLFNILCVDYTIYEESNEDQETESPS